MLPCTCKAIVMPTGCLTCCAVSNIVVASSPGLVEPSLLEQSGYKSIIGGEVETVLLGIQYKRKALSCLDDSRIHGVEIKEALYAIQPDRQMAGVSHRSIASLSVASQSAISLVDMAIRISRSCFSLPRSLHLRCSANESVGGCPCACISL